MADTGSPYTLRYPVASDVVNAHVDIQNLAEDTETALNTKLGLSGGILSGGLTGTTLSLSSTLGVTGTTTLGNVTVNGTINSRDPDDLVQGPASAVDNVLARFDSTTGKLLKSSGITVDNSNNVSGVGTFGSGAITSTGNLTINKTAPNLVLNATSSSPLISLNTAASGSLAMIAFIVGSNYRWAVSKTNGAESGSNVGSDFAFYSYDDSGIFLGTPLTITRSTGKVNLGNVGATAGLELGASGPRIMSGSGSPEGVATAPVGSQWVDTSNGFIYRKSSGSGNTGWVNGGGGAVGGGTDQAFYENDQIITTSYTITSGKNALSAGTITVGDTATVTVPSGSTWTVV